MSSSNLCGECNKCCTRHEINDDIIVKDKDVLCPKYCGTGCSIYEERPKTCSDFKCLWVIQNEYHGNYPVELRPDKSGGMVISRAPENGRGSILIEEVEEGSFDISNLSPSQTQLIDIIMTLISKQSIPVDLYYRSYDWTIQKLDVNVEEKT